MERRILAAALWLSAAATLSAELRLTADAALESPGTLDARARVAVDGFQAFLAASCGEDGIPERVTAGLACPWCAAGPLESRGLLRLAASPLSSSAGGSAWRERTGLKPAATLSPSRLGAAAFPLPDAFCLYGFREGAGTGPLEAGAFLSVPAARGLIAEAAFSACGPEVPDAGDAWYPARSRWPGGILGRAACRALFLPAGAVVSLAAGACLGFPAAPAAFVHAAAAFQGEAVSVAALLACCGRDYMASDGFGPADLLEASWKAAFGEERSGVIEGSWTYRIAQPGAVPAPYMAGRQSLGIGMRGALLHAGGFGLFLACSAQKESAWKNDGRPDGSASASGSLSAAAGAWTARASFTLADVGSWEAAARTSWDGPGGRVAAECSADGRGFSVSALSMAAEAGLRLPSGSLSLGVALEDWPPGADVSGLWECLRLSLGWKVRETVPSYR